jgi:hypothetical protein
MMADSALDRLHEQWWRGYIETLTREERETEIADRGSLWRHIAPKLAEAVQRAEDRVLLVQVRD